jgi:CRISPR/Cas system endoribonuclease Cas6 (RAMP superfamily)
LSAAGELMKICYDWGSGSKFSLGFGMVEEMDRENKLKK